MTFDWTPQRETICALYLRQGWTLKEIKQYMENEHAFKAKTRSYRVKLREWNALKSSSNSARHSVPVSWAGSNEDSCSCACKRRFESIEPEEESDYSLATSKAARWQSSSHFHPINTPETVPAQFDDRLSSLHSSPNGIFNAPPRDGAMETDEQETAHALISLKHSASSYSHSKHPPLWPATGRPSFMSFNPDGRRASEQVFNSRSDT